MAKNPIDSIERNQIWEHADGGRYVVLGHCQMKHPEKARVQGKKKIKEKRDDWREGIAYYPLSGDQTPLYCRPIRNFAKRFTNTGEMYPLQALEINADERNESEVAEESGTAGGPAQPEHNEAAEASLGDQEQT